MKIRIGGPAAVDRDWSVQQQDVFAAVSMGTRPLVIRARAGSGKTTTLLESLRRVPREELRVMLCAFNKSIAEELRRRAPRLVEVRTLHAFGYQALKDAWGSTLDVDYHRGRKLLRQALKDAEEARVQQEAEAGTKKARKQTVPNEDFVELLDILSLCKARLCTAEVDIVRLVRNRLPRERAPVYAAAILAAMRAACIPGGTVNPQQVLGGPGSPLPTPRSPLLTVDYDDMVFVPAMMPSVRVPTFDLVMVDEVQDMNRAQLALARKALGKTGRLVVVGDDKQGIYAFNGADTGFMDRMIVELEAEERRLSVTYRCPKRVVALAQRVVPDIEARTDAPEGQVVTVDLPNADFAVGDVVLSRFNAPLVRLALDAIRRGIPARIAGRDVFDGIEKLLANLKPKDLDVLFGALRSMVKDSANKLADTEPDSEEQDTARAVYEDVVDRAGTLFALAHGTKSLADIGRRMASLCEGDSPALVFSSVHKAKGLEWNRVFLLASTFRPEMDDEEANLWYVAVTRAKSSLFLIPRVSRDDRPIRSPLINEALGYGRGWGLPERQEEDEAGSVPTVDFGESPPWDAWVDDGRFDDDPS